MEQLGQQWKYYNQMNYSSNFPKFDKNIQHLVRFASKKLYFTWRILCVYDNICLDWDIFQTTFEYKIKAHILC